MKRFTYAFLLIVAFSAAVSAQPVALLKSVFIYNFGNMVEWQDSDKSGDFVIGVLGGSEVATELKKIAGTKKVGTQAIKVMNFSTASEISKCHIIVISEDKKAELSSVISKGKNTLIVSEESGAAKKGAGISFNSCGRKNEI